MTEDQIKHVVDRFLSWKLPADFHPDCGIHFDAEAAIKMDPRNGRYEPVGTNLLTATQATEMVRNMLEGMNPMREGKKVYVVYYQDREGRSAPLGAFSNERDACLYVMGKGLEIVEVPLDPTP